MSNGSGVTEGLYRVRRRNQNAGPFASPRVVSNPPERVDRARGKWIFPRRPPRARMRVALPSDAHPTRIRRDVSLSWHVLVVSYIITYMGYIVIEYDMI